MRMLKARRISETAARVRAMTSVSPRPSIFEASRLEPKAKYRTVLESSPKTSGGSMR